MMRNTSTVLALGLVLSAGAVTWPWAQERAGAASVKPEATTLSPTELHALIERRAPIHVYDANVRDSYLEGHVPGAKWVKYDAVKRAGLPQARDAMLVFYCHNPQCGASHLAAGQARALGYRNVWRMPAGIVGWRAARLPVVAGATAH